MAISSLKKVALEEAGVKNLPSFLLGEKKIIFFGGKGGVGKTTCAASSALLLNQLYPNKKILLLSLDPAHSISDSLECEVKAMPTEIANNLWSQEVNAQTLYREFIEQNKKYFLTLANRGTYFEEKDLEQFFELSIPGIDEVMGIFYLIKLIQEKQYDILVVDTAPTGHTIRLLSLPYVMERWISVFNLMQEKHRYLKACFSRNSEPDESDHFLEETQSKLETFEKLLCDPAQTEFVVVTIPEPMALFEAQRLIDKLKKDGISIQNVIVNRNSPENSCAFCHQRMTLETKSLNPYLEKWKNFNCLKVPLLNHEVKGSPSLLNTAQYFYSGESHERTPPSIFLIDPPKWSLKPQLDGLRLSNGKIKFLIFSGKGGVGKTTMACSAGLFLAQEFSRKKILIFSTDPAHSLSDSFAQNIGAYGCQVEGFTNLYAKEIDSDALLREFKEEYKTEVQNLFENILGDHIDLKFDREVMEGLIELCPPGVDELMALNQMIKLDQEKQYDLFILDSAPTGHLLRLLETPEVVREWLKAIFELLLKYKGVVRLGALAQKLIELSRNIRHIHELLIDKEKTKVTVVTIAEDMGVLETQDLVRCLNQLKMPLSQIIINNIVPQTNCAFCQSRRSEQLNYIKKIRKISPWNCSVSEIPQCPTPLQGESLKEFAEHIFY